MTLCRRWRGSTACISPTNWWTTTSRLSSHTTKGKLGPCCQLLPPMWPEITSTAFWWAAPTQPQGFTGRKPGDRHQIFQPHQLCREADLASPRCFSLLNGWEDAQLGCLFFFHPCEATSVRAFSYRGPDFPLTSMISIYYLLSCRADEGHIIPNVIMWTCYSTGPMFI